MSQPLNNLDIIILIILGLSALIALSRGLIKEVLSIIGWVLGSAAVIYLLPVFTPITKEYIANGMIAGVVTSIFILILFMVIWILLTGNIVGKVRSSKLSSVDRVLGLFFGIMRAFFAGYSAQYSHQLDYAQRPSAGNFQKLALFSVSRRICPADRKPHPAGDIGYDSQ